MITRAFSGALILCSKIKVDQICWIRKEKDMKRLFISQPMKGKTDGEILRERERAVKTAEKELGEPVEVIDSFFQSAPADARPLWFLGKSLELLSTADVVYFASGWQEARGCLIEHECAVRYGVDIVG